MHGCFVINEMTSVQKNTRQSVCLWGVAATAAGVKRWAESRAEMCPTEFIPSTIWIHVRPPISSIFNRVFKVMNGHIHPKRINIEGFMEEALTLAAIVGSHALPQLPPLAHWSHPTCITRCYKSSWLCSCQPAVIAIDGSVPTGHWSSDRYVVNLVSSGFTQGSITSFCFPITVLTWGDQKD